MDKKIYLEPLFIVTGALLDKAWGPGWGTYHHAFPPAKGLEQMKTPIITYRVVREVPAALGPSGQVELNPRMRAEEVDADGSVIMTIGVGRDYTVRFGCWAKDQQTAWETCEKFDEFFTTYFGYFQLQVPFIQRIVFQGAEGDSPDVARWRVNLYGSHVDYLVKVDKQKKIRSRTLNEIKVALKQVVTSMEGLVNYLRSVEGDIS